MSDKTDKQGFAGFEGLVSDLSEETKQSSGTKSTFTNQTKSTDNRQENRIPPKSPSNSRTKSSTWYVDAAGNVFDREPAQPSQAKPNPQQKDPYEDKTPKSLIYAVLGIGLIGFVCYQTLAYFENKRPAVSAPSAAVTTEPVSVPSQEPPVTIPKPEQPKIHKKNVTKNTEINEEMPPVGDGLVFNNSQIAYCQAQKIRITAMKSVLDDTDKGDIDTFNNAIADFNSRCAHYKYRRGSLEYVRDKVEANRYNIESEGKRVITSLH